MVDYINPFPFSFIFYHVKYFILKTNRHEKKFRF
jgi:hypothetical protein